MDGPEMRFSFRPLQREDLPLISRWRSAEHVARWWGEPGELEAEYFPASEPGAEYLPAGAPAGERTPSGDLTRYLIALLDGRPVGLVQHYHWADLPAEAEGIGADADEDGIDYFLGEANLLGVGLGPAMLHAFLEQVVMAGPARGVRLDVSQANRRSWRCLEKLGFHREREGVLIPGEPGPHYVYALRLGNGQGAERRSLRRPSQGVGS